MVSRCLRGSSLLGACGQKTQRNRRSAHHLTSRCVTLLHPSFQVPLGVILCPNVARSGAAWDRPSGIPPRKYLHSETSGLALAKNRESRPGTLSLAEPYTAMSEGAEDGGAEEWRSGGGRDERNAQAQRWRQEEEDGWTGGRV